jgi:hypothetical protein
MANLANGSPNLCGPDFAERIPIYRRSFRLCAIACPRSDVAKAVTNHDAANFERPPISKNSPISTMVGMEIRRRAEQMNMIWHDDVAPDKP